MNFKQRLILFVTTLMTTTVVITALLLTWNTYNELIDEAESEGELVALLLARSIGAAEHVPVAVEEFLGKQMIVEATLAAYLVAVAEKLGFQPREISNIFKDISNESALEEVWITDEHGQAYINNSDMDFTFSPDPHEQPQAHAFWPLISGEKLQVIQQASAREIDGKLFKYAGVRGVDKARIVQVGFSMDLLDDIAQRVGVDFMVNSLLVGSDINAIWLLDNNRNTLAYGSLKGTHINPAPSDKEQDVLEQVYRSKQVSSLIDNHQMTVIAPLHAIENHSGGVVLVRLPLDRLSALIVRDLSIAAAVAFGVVLVGWLLSVVVAGRVTRPILAMTSAAERIQAGQYDPDMLLAEAKRGDELGRLATIFRDMAAKIFARVEKLDAMVQVRTRELQEKNTQLEIAQQTIQNELKVARSLQLRILPTEFPQHPDYEIYGNMKPAKDMSGDFYDVFSIDQYRLGLVIADVSGKGVPAAFFMAVARTELQEIALHGGRPGEVLAKTNNALCDLNPLSLFVTVFYGILDLRSGLLNYANGGHNPPLLVDKEDARPLPLTGGMALGVMPDQEYRNYSLKLTKRHTIFLYTDGITEAFNEMDEAFGTERLQQYLIINQALDAKTLTLSAVAAVEEFIGIGDQSDDITCMTIRLL